MRGGERLKFDPDPVCAAPPNDGMFDEDRRLVFRDIEEEIDFHARDGSKGTLDSASPARKVQGFGNAVQAILMAERAGKCRGESGVLPHDHTRPRH
jgi:hypothetical protein